MPHAPHTPRPPLSPRPPRKTSRTPALAVMTIAASITIAIIAIELALGGWLGIRKTGRLRIIKNLSMTRDAGKYHGQPATIRYTRDRYGLRGDYGADPSKITILTVGGSTTDQIMTDDSRTWQALLALRLRGARIANAGVDGQTTVAHIENFKQWFPQIPGLKPALVIFYAGVNDFYQTESDDPSHKGGLELTLLRNSALYSLYRVFEGWHRVYFRCPLLGHRSVDFTKAKWTNAPPAPGIPGFAKQRVELFGERLSKLAALARGMGAAAVFVTQKFAVWRSTPGGLEGIDDDFEYPGMRANGVDVHALMSLYNHMTLDRCRAAGAKCIDLASELRLEVTDYYDYVHTNRTGTEKIAGYLAEKL